MAFLAPFFQHDVFVSYAHGVGPGASESPLKRWTHRLIRELKSEIHSVSKRFDALALWSDEEIDPTNLLTPELRGKVENSGLLMIIMSERYLESAWCRKEYNWFRHERDQGRVFVIRALPTNEIDWPDFLRDDEGHPFVGFAFHAANAKRPYCWPETPIDEAYAKQLSWLADKLTARLLELRALNIEDGRRRLIKAELLLQKLAPRIQNPEPDRSKLESGSPKTLPRVYLHARPEFAPIYQEVRRTLAAGGIESVTAETDAGRWRPEMAQRCEALALVRARADELGEKSFEAELFEIGYDERNRCEVARGRPLPCAVLDGSGKPLPKDIAFFGIEQFDISSSDWCSKFRGWLAETPFPPARV